MQVELFSEEWARGWGERINRNEAYRKAARHWEWPVVLEMWEDGADGNRTRGIYLDLWHGACRQARAATAEDYEHAPYLISGSEQTWLRILNDDLDPIMALMRGKLKLKKGKMMTLARFGAAAKQLVLSAREIAAPQADPKVKEIPEKTIPVMQRVHQGFRTTSGAGLRHTMLPMRLYHKAKKLGVWDPRDIDFSRDIEQWQAASELERESLLHQTALFQAGEESVTLDLLPLIMVIAREGRLEEEMYLTTFLWEEAKHTEFFRRFLDEVTGVTDDLSRFHGPNYRKLFYEELPQAMNALLVDSSPSAQLRASVTYNMIVEGVLAETGYHGYFSALEENDLLPGLRQGIGLLKRDESRHIAYGIYLISRLVAAHPSLYREVEAHMERLLELALGTITEIFDCYEVMPFGLKLEDFLEYAMSQFNKRMEGIERARQQGLEAFELESLLEA